MSNQFQVDDIRKPVAHLDKQKERLILRKFFYCAMPYCNYARHTPGWQYCPQCGAHHSCRVGVPYTPPERARIWNHMIGEAK